ncbi:MAG: hypothetical protein HYR96_03505 [Deltaproteobacteria bacterium]|nr:hypothetical protein [Deltaproteobacteria bacterium]MBI3295183.1 hypothetical protein [Deltaproteobacteria bacterium]
MKTILALFAFISAAFADKPPASAVHTPKENTTRVRPPAVEPPGEVVKQSSDELKVMENAIRELNAFGPTRQVGEVEVAEQSPPTLPKELQ